MMDLRGVLTVAENGIFADELQRDRFYVVENIVDTKPYVDIMAGISAISSGMNWVKDYDQYPSRKFEYPFAYLSANLKNGMKVLDAGCSIDPFAPFLASKEAKVFGVDNFASHDVPWDYEGGIFHGRYKGFKKAQLYNEHLKSKYGFSVNYCNSDIASMPFPDQSFERIFCISVLEHLPKWKTFMVFDEWRRILKKDGKVILTIDYVSDGQQSFNIGRILRKSGFALQGEVTVYPSISVTENKSILVAGFVISPKQIHYNASLFSEVYRGNRIIKTLVDTVLTFVDKVYRKFMR